MKMVEEGLFGDIFFTASEVIPFEDGRIFWVHLLRFGYSLNENFSII